MPLKNACFERSQPVSLCCDESYNGRVSTWKINTKGKEKGKVPYRPVCTIKKNCSAIHSLFFNINYL